MLRWTRTHRPPGHAARIRIKARRGEATERLPQTRRKLVDEKEVLKAQIKAYEFYAGLIERAVGGGQQAKLPRWDEQRAIEYRDLAAQLRARLAELEAQEAPEAAAPEAAAPEAASAGSPPASAHDESPVTSAPNSAAEPSARG